MTNVNNASQDEVSLEKSVIHIRLRATHKITFFLGVVFGVFAVNIGRDVEIKISLEIHMHSIFVVSNTPIVLKCLYTFRAKFNG